MMPHSLAERSPIPERDRIWPFNDVATIAVAVMIAIFLAYAVGWFVGYADGQAVR